VNGDESCGLRQIGCGVVPCTLKLSVWLETFFRGIACTMQIPKVFILMRWQASFSPLVIDHAGASSSLGVVFLWKQAHSVRFLIWSY